MAKARLEGNYYWIKVSPQRWAKVKRYVRKLERSGEEFGAKLTVNRVAGRIFAEAVDKLP